MYWLVSRNNNNNNKNNSRKWHKYSKPNENGRLHFHIYGFILVLGFFLFLINATLCNRNLKFRIGTFCNQQNRTYRNGHHRRCYTHRWVVWHGRTSESAQTHAFGGMFYHSNYAACFNIVLAGLLKKLQAAKSFAYYKPAIGSLIQFSPGTQMCANHLSVALCVKWNAFRWTIHCATMYSSFVEQFNAVAEFRSVIGNWK